MSEFEPGKKLKYLLEANTQALLATLCADKRDDLALSNSPQLKGLLPFERHALLEQKKLRHKAIKKCWSGNEGDNGTEETEVTELFFTQLGLEQMTHWELGQYKGKLFPEGIESIVDLCCGLGGDSFFIPEKINVVGVDYSLDTLRAYRHNVSKFRSAKSVLADVTTHAVKADVALLDPSRMAKGKSDRWQDEDLSPNWNEIEKLIQHYRNMAIKLGPGVQIPEFLQDYECQYLGLRDECLEALVLTGTLGRRGIIKAVELPSGESVEAFKADIENTFNRIESPGKFLFEPVKSVVRAHLFGVLAEKLGLWQIDPRIAYLSGNEYVSSALLKPYQILKELPYDLKVVKTFLRENEVGRLEIKKRGLNLIPEEFRAKIRLSGPNEGTLIFTRVNDRKTVFWARAINHPLQKWFGPR